MRAGEASTASAWERVDHDLEEIVNSYLEFAEDDTMAAAKA